MTPTALGCGRHSLLHFRVLAWLDRRGRLEASDGRTFGNVTRPLVARESNRAYFQSVQPLVLELEIEADYGQIYIYDPATQLADQDATEDDPLERAMKDGYESRRFVGYARGLIDVITPSQYNWKAPIRIEVSEAPPESDAESWDHVVELPLPVPSGRLVFEASGGGAPIETQIPTGNYRARFSGRGYVAGVGEIEGHETYRLQLWPSEKTELRLVRYWAGYDLMRPSS